MKANAHQHLRIDAPALRHTLEILRFELGWQTAERALPKNTPPCFLQRGAAGIAADNLDGRAVEPPRLLQDHCNRKRLFACSASRAPNSQRSRVLCKPCGNEN